MKGRVRRTKLSRFLWIFGRPLHPVRTGFALAGSFALSLPCFLFYLKFRYMELSAFIIYPVLFITAHLIWFRLPFVKKNLRWLLFWITVAIVIALSAGFIFSVSYEHGVLRQALSNGLGLKKRDADFLFWMEREYKNGNVFLSLYFIIPALIISLIYSFLLLFALKIYRSGRIAWYRKLTGKKTK